MMPAVETKKDDLPDRFGAMLVKELRQNMRRGSFVYPFLGIHLFAIIALIMEFQGEAGYSYEKNAGMLNVALLADSGPFWIVVSIICAVVMPLGGLILMGQELDEGNHELLLLTKLSRWKVVRGKFFTLWGLSALTFISLLPYVIVRYNVGAIEVIREAACSATVVGIAAMMCAGAIGASAFRGLMARIGVMILFIGSMFAGCGIPLLGAANMAKSPGSFAIFFNLNGLAGTVCYTTLGLALARSRLRLVIHAYEVKPSYMVVGLLVFTPFVVGMATAMTGFYAGFVGLIGMTLVAIYADATPKAPAWVKPPAANMPPPPPMQGGPAQPAA